MFRIASIVIVLILALNQIGRADVPEQIHLRVYYESKCPDSSDFILDQLQPAVRLLQNSLILQLIPFGKADSINDGHIQFKCQHGPRECRGNLVQDCALNAMRHRSDLDKVAYVACEMETEAGTRGDMHCVNQANISVMEVEECVSSYKGVELQLASEDLTKEIRPKFIPTITFGRTFNQYIQDSAMSDLIGTICTMFKDLPNCARHYNHKAMVQLHE